jgi:hypothetical protein
VRCCRGGSLGAGFEKLSRGGSRDVGRVERGWVAAERVVEIVRMCFASLLREIIPSQIVLRSEKTTLRRFWPDERQNVNKPRTLGG